VDFFFFGGGGGGGVGRVMIPQFPAIIWELKLFVFCFSLLLQVFRLVLSLGLKDQLC
jgi:hypothetical protein